MAGLPRSPIWLATIISAAAACGGSDAGPSVPSAMAGANGGGRGSAAGSGSLAGVGSSGGSGTGGAGSTSTGGSAAADDAGMPMQGTSCAPLPAASDAIEVGPSDDLAAMVYDAAPGTTFALADGTYALGGSILQLRAAGVTLRGASGDREAVILDGEYAQASGEVVAISASNVTVAALTIAHAYTHAIHVQTPSGDVTGTRIYDVHVLDAAEQGIKINLDASGASFPDDGEIACSHIELTEAGRAQVRNNCYTGGIDAHGVRGWTIRDNRIEGFYCAQGLSEHGVHFWTGSRDTLIERNQIRNCARGVGLGLGETTSSSSDAWRTYGDDPCPGKTPVGHYGGIVRNNFVFADEAALFASQFGFDSGVDLEQACDASVVHNTIFAETPPLSSAVEWRFANTSARVVNNLANAAFEDRGGGATVTAEGNLDTASAAFFVDAAQGDLHLLATTAASGAGASVDPGLCDDDIDGDPRAARDVGADELR